MSEILIFIGFALLYFLLDAAHDSNMQKWRSANNGNDIRHYSRNWHTIDAVIKGMVGLLLAYLLFGGITWLAGQYLLLFLTIRWIWFDAALNLFNGLPITYVGSTAFLDKIFRMKNTQFIFKFVILTIIIYSLFAC